MSLHTCMKQSYLPLKLICHCSATVLILRCDGHCCGWQETDWTKGSLPMPSSNICPRVCAFERERESMHAPVDMPAHHVSAISGSLLPSWFPHSGSQSVCSAIGSTQLTAATATCQLAAPSLIIAALASVNRWVVPLMLIHRASSTLRIQIRKFLPLAS